MGAKPSLDTHDWAGVQAAATSHMAAAICPSPTGNISLLLNYTSSSDVDVGCYRQRYASTLNMSAHRPLHVEIYGDGSGATLVLQLEDKYPFFSDFFINITWKGWRRVRMDVAATRELFKYPQLTMPAYPNMAM
jgi:hypothetical protein